MHNNYYFLIKLSKSIGEIISGMELTTCFTQNKNELILGFTSEKQTFYIKAHLQSDFCCLAFPKDFSRSRRNSMDLFREIIHQKVSGTRQYLNERCFSIDFENGFQLLFKMHGNRSNIILFQNKKLISRFNHHLKNDETINLDTLDRNITQTREALNLPSGDYKVLYPTFDKNIHQYIEQKGYDSLSTDQRWELLKTVENELLDNHYYIINKEGKPAFSLLSFGEIQQQLTDPILAINTFFQSYVKQSSLLKEKRATTTTLTSKINRTKSYIKKSEKKLKTLADNSNYSQWADIIMANLDQIPIRAKEVSLQDLYNDLRPITIKLKSVYSPQKNAEIYYRKSKNQQIELDKLQESINIKTQQLALLETHYQFVIGATDFKVLRNYLKEHQLTKAKQAMIEAPKPYIGYELEGFDVWVGKNAKHNDTLTQKLSYKEDLWLHAKDVSGSHVLIKYKAGKPFPKRIIEYAAQLAAYYSKRKTDSLCPVIYTPKKYVRKVKGTPAGAVIVDKEQVILVTPIRKEAL